MNVYVSVDIEGISGVVHADMMMPGEREYDRGRRLMTAERTGSPGGSSTRRGAHGPTTRS